MVYPFADPSAVNEQLLGKLNTALRSVSAFKCRFSRTGWFSTDVLWLDPDPVAPFRQLTAAVLNEFPGYPPYGGAHAEVVPHLTVGERRLADLSALQSAEQDVRRGLPIAAAVDNVLLIAGTNATNSWRTVHRFGLDGTLK